MLLPLPFQAFPVHHEYVKKFKKGAPSTEDSGGPGLGCMRRKMCFEQSSASASAAIAGEDLPSLRGALAACYGKDGNFTVIVEGQSGDVPSSSNEIGATAKRKKRMRSDMLENAKDAEATVLWSSLLAQWSPVFERMVGCDSYVAEVAGRHPRLFSWCC